MPEEIWTPTVNLKFVGGTLYQLWVKAVDPAGPAVTEWRPVPSE